MLRRVLLTAGLSLAASASAQAPVRVTPTPADFSIQMPLEVSGKNGVVQLALPKQVYLQAQTADLADLRIYNSQGELLPFAFFHPYPLPRAAASISFRESQTTLFPVRDGARSAAVGELQLEVKAAPDGSLLAISARREDRGPSAELSALIVDLGPSAVEETLEGLQLALADATSEYRATLSVERSDDLKLWDRVAQTNIDWLSGTGDERLVNDRIEIPESFGRYLRIRWIEGEPATFASIRARWRSAHADVEDAVADSIFEERLAARAGRVPGDFVYVASPAIAATEIGLNLPEPNTVLPVAIGFYQELRGSQPAWRFEPRVENTFYRLIQDGKERNSSRLSMAPLAGSEWVVRTQSDAQAAQAAGPELVLRWKPGTLAFTARGSGFVLAFGAPPEKARLYTHGATELERVAPGYRPDELSALESAQPGAAFATPARAIPSPSTPKPVVADTRDQRKMLLWGVLIIGVLVLAYMSWRLFKQLGVDKIG